MSETETKTPHPETKSREERVAVIAYQLWEEEGRPEGRAEEHWLMACAMIDAVDEMSSSQPPAWLARKNKSAPQIKAEKTPETKAEAPVSELPQQARSRTAA